MVHVIASFFFHSLCIFCIDWESQSGWSWKWKVQQAARARKGGPEPKKNALLCSVAGLSPAHTLSIDWAMPPFASLHLAYTADVLSR